MEKDFHSPIRQLHKLTSTGATVELWKEALRNAQYQMNHPLWTWQCWTSFCQCHVAVRDSTYGLANGWWFPFLNKVTWRCAPVIARVSHCLMWNLACSCNNRLLERSWDFANPVYMYSVDSKVYDFSSVSVFLATHQGFSSASCFSAWILFVVYMKRIYRHSPGDVKVYSCSLSSLWIITCNPPSKKNHVIRYPNIHGNGLKTSLTIMK